MLSEEAYNITTIFGDTTLIKYPKRHAERERKRREKIIRA
jgi:hypothetical protein